MSSNNELIQTLREAVRLSPDNIPLRLHLAEVLMKHGFVQEAEREYREALRRAPANQQIRLGLINACHQQGKHSEGLVIIEDLLQRCDLPAEAYVLYARLLLANGERKRAAEQYLKAIAADPSVADAGLAQQLQLPRSRQQHDATDAVDTRVRAALNGPTGPVETDLERPTICFSDVGGMDAVKEQIRLKIIHPLAHPELYQAYGKPIGGGVLLYGPPGCGKTLLARATAGEVKAGFIAVGINDVVEMWFGKSERNLHELFELARRNKPCVMFFDEVDALGASRSDMHADCGRRLINQFLAELDGVKSSNDGLLILAATNAPWYLDSAFRRPGRFDRIIFVPPPDVTAREAILRVLLRGKPVDDIDYSGIARKAENFSGADLKAVVDQAVERKITEVMHSGSVSPLTSSDLIDAAQKVQPSTLEWFSTARNYALYSNQGGAYDDIVRYLRLK